MIAKYQYPCYRSPNGAEGFDKGGILGRYQSGMDQIKGTARAKIGQSCFQCNRVTSPWSRTSGVRTWSWVRFIILLSWSFFWFSSVNSICVCVYYCSTFDKAVRVGGGGKWRTCTTRDNGTREEPCTLTQGGSLFSLVPCSRLGIKPKPPGWLVQAQPPAHRGT